MSYGIEWSHDRVILRFRETYDLNTNSNASHELYSDPRSNDIHIIIVDLLEITGFAFTSLQAEFPAMRDKISSTRMKDIQKVLITKDQQVADFCHHYISKSIEMRSPWEFYVASDWAETSRWLEASGKNKSTPIIA